MDEEDKEALGFAVKVAVGCVFLAGSALLLLFWGAIVILKWAID